ncbi:MULTISPECIES: hypothetical protein [Microcoleaceae]|nr:hypothetical protein [Tychonema sp. LEGE 06208]MBE9163217.1 hypothetical protein [Tychonema sp. LEGE 06208]
MKKLELLPLNIVSNILAAVDRAKCDRLVPHCGHSQDIQKTNAIIIK